MPEKPYNLFVDDTGTKEYSQVYSHGVTPFFGFGALLVTPAVAGAIHSQLRQLKRQVFGTEDIEIKANWLRRSQERSVRYLAPFHLTENSLTQFTDAVYEIIQKADCNLIGVIVDKAAVQAKYKYPHYAPAIAYDCLLQRVQMQMQDRNGRVHVTIDDMSGATPGGNQYKSNLIRQHRQLLSKGSALQQGMVFDRVGGQSFSDSNHDERLQLADLVAYAVYRQFIDYGDDWDTGGKSLPTYEYFGRLSSKFCRDHHGVITGWGVVKFPRTSETRWRIKNP